jgi:hypothetical protein
MRGTHSHDDSQKAEYLPLTGLLFVAHILLWHFGHLPKQRPSDAIQKYRSPDSCSPHLRFNTHYYLRFITHYYYYDLLHVTMFLV